ncbi:hypothetical protein K449DRAFT_465622 [Hypoxylon sp. EC38]|nr:hypothetical protein K449DRAFT_465622 [Hypoxylon sp. EC38]
MKIPFQLQKPSHLVQQKLILYFFLFIVLARKRLGLELNTVVSDLDVADGKMLIENIQVRLRYARAPAKHKAFRLSLREETCVSPLIITSFCLWPKPKSMGLIPTSKLGTVIQLNADLKHTFDAVMPIGWDAKKSLSQEEDLRATDKILEDMVEKFENANLILAGDEA